MSALTLPQPLGHVLDTWTFMLDQRQRDLLLPLFHGWLFARGRPTATSLGAMGRVAGAVAHPGSRRSVLAQLRHTARPVAGLRALCYLPALR